MSDLEYCTFQRIYVVAMETDHTDALDFLVKQGWNKVQSLQEDYAELADQRKELQQRGYSI